MSKKKVVIVLTSVARMNGDGEATGFWLSELTHPYYSIADKGIGVDIVSISGGVAPVDPKSIDLKDPENKRFMEDPALSQILKNTKKLVDIDSKSYKGIIFAGGHGTMWDFPDGIGVEDKAMAIYNKGGIIGAICHGPAALINLKDNADEYIIKDKKICGFTNKEEDIVGLTDTVPFSLEDKLKDRACKYIEKDPWSVNVEADSRIVTGQNPQSARGVGDKVADLILNG